MKSKSTVHGPGLTAFLDRHGSDVTGVISGYDRLRLRGSLRHLYQPSFMFRYLCSAGVRLKDFAGFVSSDQPCLRRFGRVRRTLRPAALLLKVRWWPGFNFSVSRLMK